MNFIKRNIGTLVTLILVAVYCFHSSSCASTKAAPSGGPKDTLPPEIVAMVPAASSTGFPVEDGEITITFNEYVQVKDANKNIILSPPLEKQVKTRIKGKSVIFTFPVALDTNTSYSLNLGQAIVDNNEGNPLYGLSYSFSTGSVLDTMMLSGTVVDAISLFPMENVTVALYEQATDSTVITTAPSAIARSDKWGYFVVKNIKPVPYYVFAYTDGNTNNRYDQGSEQIAFLNFPIVPDQIMKQDSKELQYCDPIDTVACLARPSQIQLGIFAEKNTNQFVRDYKRFSKRGSYIKFSAPLVQIDSFAIEGVNPNRIIRQLNTSGDSLVFWIGGEGKIDDTLRVAMKYMKTDSLGMQSPFVEKLKFVAPAEKKGGRKSDEERAKERERRKDLLEFSAVSDKTMVEQNGIVLSFPAPVMEFDTSKIEFTTKTPKLVESKVPFGVEQDSTEFNTYIIRPKIELIKGNEYNIIFPFATFKDVNGFTNDSTANTFTLPTDENLSSLTLEIKNVNARYIVELINAKRTRTFRKYIIEEDCELLFPYLKADEYSIRITEDKNSNGKLDTGDLLKRIQPEKVLLYKLNDEKDIITISERTDIVQELDMNEIFAPDKN
ncbi:MAG: Ig-like domain-containing protein [Bacteroidales bacterium]|nr:Ig-like domain-containing protein [Bacteroidales bacterium]